MGADDNGVRRQQRKAAAEVEETPGSIGGGVRHWGRTTKMAAAVSFDQYFSFYYFAAPPTRLVVGEGAATRVRTPFSILPKISSNVGINTN